jgi:hypothetical protein
MNNSMILEMGEGQWSVRSSTDPNHFYHLKKEGDTITCECKGYFYRNKCRHVDEVRIRMADAKKIEMKEKELLNKPDGVYPNGDEEVLVESDKLDITRKTLWVKSSRLHSDNKQTWIQRKELTASDRKKILKESIDMEHTFIPMHRLSDEFIEELSDSDLFIYHKMLNDLLNTATV